MFPIDRDGEGPARAARPLAAPEASLTKSKLILVVDDHVGIQRVLRRLLTIEGHDVLTVGTGHDAIQVAVEQQPDLVLLDLMLPDMDGVEVSATIRRTPPLLDVPIVMLTACSDPDDQMDGYLAGANEYITKPLEFDLLLEVVNRYLTGAKKAA